MNDVRHRMFNSPEEIAFGGITPEGELFYVTDEGVYKRRNGYSFDTGIGSCNGITPFDGQVLIGGRTGTRIFSDWNETPRLELDLAVGAIGLAAKQEMAIAAFGKRGFALLSARGGQLGGYYFGPPIVGETPRWLSTPHYSWKVDGASGPTFLSPEFLELSESLVRVAFAGGRRGLIMFSCGRDRDSLFSVRGYEVDDLDLASISIHSASGLLVGLDHRGILCILQSARPDDTLCLKLLDAPELSYYKVLVVNDSIAVLTNRGILWMTGVFQVLPGNESRFDPSRIAMGWLPTFYGIDMTLSQGHLIVIQPEAVVDAEVVDIESVALQHPNLSGARVFTKMVKASLVDVGGA